MDRATLARSALANYAEMTDASQTPLGHTPKGLLIIFELHNYVGTSNHRIPSAPVKTE